MREVERGQAREEVKMNWRCRWRDGRGRLFIVVLLRERCVGLLMAGIGYVERFSNIGCCGSIGKVDRLALSKLYEQRPGCACRLSSVHLFYLQ